MAECGKIPLQMASLHGNSTEAIQHLLNAYPGSAFQQDRTGRSAENYAIDNASPKNRDIICVLNHAKVKRKEALNEVMESFDSTAALDGRRSPRDEMAETMASLKSSKLKRRSSTKKCVVCLEKNVSRVIVPCGHPCLCDDCGTSSGLERMGWNCPECRGEVQDAIRFFGRVVNDE